MPCSYHQVTAAQLPPRALGRLAFGAEVQRVAGGVGEPGPGRELAGGAAHQERINNKNVVHIYRAACARLSPH